MSESHTGGQRPEVSIPALMPIGDNLSLLSPQEINGTRRIEAKAALLESKGMLPRVTQWDCRYQRYRLVDKATGESMEFDCKQWSCVVHGPRVAWRWRLRLGAVPWQYMITLTLVPADQRDARVAWARVARWMRATGHMTTFARVLEYGGRTGMRHWHVLIRGESWDKSDLRSLRDESRKAGLGTRVHVARVGDRVGAVGYLLKYALKDIGVLDARRRGWRCITVSRDIPAYSRVLARLGKENEGREFGLWKGETHG